MSDSHGNKGTSSAISEKKQSNRGGGCVGILFQLFDWHRRFAKKQLFKGKLLPPPAVVKQAVKKFKGNEKMPTAKLHLITAENKGGFPIMRKNGGRNVDAEQKHGTQAPGLVARLMGLETMPLVHQKVKKNSPPETYNDKREKVIGSRILRKEDLNEEKGDMKQVLRPPKLQKAGESDERTVSRFGGETLQIKNVLSRSRKHHPHKLVTPVKSPRITPTNNVSRTSSRLIDAATKILEPGLQVKTSSKCALPYSSSPQHASVEQEMAERSLFASANMQRHAVTSENLANGNSMGQSSCKNCGNLLDIMDCRPIMLEEICNHNSISPHHFDDSCQGNGMDRQRPARSDVVPQKTIFHKGRQQEYLVAGSISEYRDGGQIKDIKSFMESWDGWLIDSQKHNPYGNEKAVEERITNGYLKGRSASRSLGVTSNYNKDFVALNHSMSSITRPRSPVRAECSETDVARRTRTRRSESLSEMKPPLLKMRSSIEHPTSAIPLLAKQKSRSELPGTGNRARCSENDNGVVSLTFQSAVNYKTGYSKEGKNNRQGPGGFNRKTISGIKSGLGENRNDGLQQKHFALSGDALVAFLEQKLKELTFQEEATISCKMSKRSTAVNKEESLPEYGATADSKKASQVKPSFHNAAKVLPDVNSLSPGSVLEASFSIDSCVSSSCDDVSGSNLTAHPVDYSFDSSRAIVQDVELLDSATSFNMGGTHLIKLTSLIGRVASMMDSLILADGRFSGSKVNLTKDIILKAELPFASFSHENSKCLEYIICTFLQMECTEVKALFSLGDAEVGSEMKAFTLDCLLECFDKGYRRYCNFGYKGWARQLSSWSPEILRLDIVNEVRRWAGLSGSTPDEIIEHDMSHSIGKWADFNIEAFELGATFANDMLADVVEEIAASILCPARWAHNSRLPSAVFLSTLQLHERNECEDNMH